jgi:hypothetical protein
MGKLILKRASASRPSGQWSDDDYDVLEDDRVVGRIFNAAASPVGTPWMWTLAFDYRGSPRRTAMRRRARLRCRHSRGVGTERRARALVRQSRLWSRLTLRLASVGRRRKSLPPEPRSIVIIARKEHVSSNTVAFAGQFQTRSTE